MPPTTGNGGPTSAGAFPPPGEGCQIPIPPQHEQWRGKILFLEVFAGYGVLTATLKGCGLPTLPPDEYFLGGTDFSDRREVQKLREWLEAMVETQER